MMWLGNPCVSLDSPICKPSSCAIGQGIGKGGAAPPKFVAGHRGHPVKRRVAGVERVAKYNGVIKENL